MVEQSSQIAAQVIDVDLWYGNTHALKKVSLPIYRNQVSALIGPSGCGKTTLLRCFNRMHDLYKNVAYSGEIKLYPEGMNILDTNINPVKIRQKIGMVFQKPNPFPKSIYENVYYGLDVQHKTKDAEQCITQALQDAGLWNEVKDILNKPATELSGGQQQRLCIARALAPQPEILLLDEPTSALDPIATAKIEELIKALKSKVSIIIVTHSMEQARRISDNVGFMYLGDLIEYGEAQSIFNKPQHALTEQYISGRFG